ncbi:transposase [Paenibacillus alba]|uniref:transposase n=1 Tax=Paenibacillus alba TaxID=1197127 RepID=UPI00156437DC|nr:transposase [Paenibacillus alba]NQX65052.1 transposase [Paenibacillus alba]
MKLWQEFVDMDLSIFLTEEDCEKYLLSLRWANGFCCPRCDYHEAFHIRSRRLLECKECRMQISLTAGTIMHKSKLSLLLWFRAIQLLVQSDHRYSATSLSQILGINYRSAQLLLKKIYFAFVSEENWKNSFRKMEASNSATRLDTVANHQDEHSSIPIDKWDLVSCMASKVSRLHEKITFKKVTPKLYLGYAFHAHKFESGMSCPYSFNKWFKKFVSIHLYRSFFKCYQITG